MEERVTDWSRGLELKAGEWFLGLYQPSPETVGYWDGVKAHELRLKHCAACDRALHPKRIVCTDCGSDALAWKRASGRGEVYSFSEVHRAPSPAFAGSVPYTVGIVKLEEGVFLFSRLQGGPVAIGAKAEVGFRVLELGNLMPVFTVKA
ncbi:Zn-ribbon domain-containing OB-fold protein [Falsiroseomonas sp. HW251]|uniref:Zn-ribbon domain-containing OB-fold protein n=1 Tax=Falsiroseomonas sp. HW251 TaxID=3390998 RepID=UPI003D321341